LPILCEKNTRGELINLGKKHYLPLKGYCLTNKGVRRHQWILQFDASSPVVGDRREAEITHRLVRYVGVYLASSNISHRGVRTV